MPRYTRVRYLLRLGLNSEKRAIKLGGTSARQPQKINNTWFRLPLAFGQRQMLHNRNGVERLFGRVPIHITSLRHLSWSAGNTAWCLTLYQNCGWTSNEVLPRRYIVSCQMCRSLAQESYLEGRCGAGGQTTWGREGVGNTENQRSHRTRRRAVRRTFGDSFFLPPVYLCLRVCVVVFLSLSL